MGHDIRMLQRKVHGMVATKTASGHGQPRGLILPAQEGKEFMQNVALILEMAHHPLARMNTFVVPTLRVDCIGTEYLQLSALNLRRHYTDHASIFVFKEPAHRGRKHQQRRATMSEDQGFHIAMKFLAIASVIFAVHLLEQSERRSILPDSAGRVETDGSDIRV